MESVVLLINKKNVKVEYFEDKGYIYVKWIGFQSTEKVIESGKEILAVFRTTKCSKVINDNRLVTGPWSKASDWVEKEWFPQMISAGMKKFAWIFPDNVFAELSASKAMPDTGMVKKFDEYKSAENWLTN
ncbi:hypothetical protein R9C00_12160 [Flammeovirgaceae bacterium SG7u.111]|nr:hypothetical protein [Flammeovirgaceae bacterium SG7u.132]WPO38207.1 hypothetical protein R9C00_12160 [Flammeovirgaceae bacterium SG7u.111]